jgi:hypothetical protein
LLGIELASFEGSELTMEMGSLEGSKLGLLDGSLLEMLEILGSLDAMELVDGIMLGERLVQDGAKEMLGSGLSDGMLVLLLHFPPYLLLGQTSRWDGRWQQQAWHCTWQ